MCYFSVIIPTYNRANLIKNTVESVLAQSYKDFEVIVIDDGSADNTGEIVGGIKDERVKYHYKKNEERCIARNTGTQMAKGKYVGFLDSDDAYYPNHLQTALEVIEKYGEPEAIHLGYEIRDDESGSVKTIDNLPETAKEILPKGNYLSCNGIVLRSDIAKKHLFNPNLTAHEDYELWLRISSRYPIYCDNRITSVITEHGDRSVLTTTAERLIGNIMSFEATLFKDEVFLKAYGESLDIIKTNNRVYIALHLALMKKHRLKAIQFLTKALSVSPKALKNRAFYGTLKRLFI